MTPILTKIFRDNWDKAVEESDSIEMKRPAVIKNVKKIINCKTLKIGVRAFKCENPKCNHTIYSPNTCKSRVCPSCAFKATLNWQGAFLHRVIQSEYQHIVFSGPALLKELFISGNRKLVINAMYSAASKSILEFCKKREGYLPGIMGVFQSFGKSLNEHPHIHMIRTAGGISLDDGKTWIDSCYLPEKMLKARFKAKVLKALRALFREGEIKGYLGKMSYAEFNKKLNAIHETNWFVWIGNTEEADNFIPYFYISRYLFRACISSKRIVDYAKGLYVRWLPQSKYKLSKTQAFKDTVVAFIEKIIVHIPDEYVHNIRYSGLYAPKYRKTYYRSAQEHFKKKNPHGLEKLKEHIPMKWADLIEMAFDKNPLECPECGSKMKFVKLIFFSKIELDELELREHQIIAKEEPG